MAKTFTSKRECSGSYQITAYGRTVLVFRCDELDGAAKWNWRDENTRDCYGDPVMTKADAIEDVVAYCQHRAENPDAWR